MRSHAHHVVVRAACGRLCVERGLLIKKEKMNVNTADEKEMPYLLPILNDNTNCVCVKERRKEKRGQQKI